VCWCDLTKANKVLCSISTDAAGKLHVPDHDRHTLGVDGAEVGVLEQTDQKSLCSFLEGAKRRALEAKLWFVVLGDLADETLERELSE
jgi:hypothetical protein